MLAYCQLDPWEEISVKFESKYTAMFTKGSELENVVLKMATNLPRPQIVNWSPELG